MPSEHNDFNIIYKKVYEFIEKHDIDISAEELDRYEKIRALCEIIRDIQTPRPLSYSST